MHRVLAYSRPSWHDWWVKVVTSAFEDCTIEYLSEFKTQTYIWIMGEFYKYWNHGEVEQKLNDELIYEEVIARDRLLRNLDKNKAENIIDAMWSALNAILDEWKPTIVISITVDHYVLDLLSRACREKGIQFIGVSNCPLSGYSLITERGELNLIRQPSTQEVESAVKELQTPEYKPAYTTLKEYTFPGHVSRVLKFNAKRIVSWLKRYKDPMNFFYIALPYFTDRKNIFYYFSIRYFDYEYKSKLESTKLPVVYIPLHYVPEATVDYWTRRLESIKYERELFKLIEALGDKVLIVIKEHPASIGTRNSEFYKRLLNTNNLLLVSPNESSRDVLSNSDYVITWTGTVGLEASIMGKTVFLIGDPYYYEESSFIKIKDVGEFKNIQLDGISSCLSNSRERANKIITNLLSGTVRGTFGQKGYMNDENARVLSQSIREYCYYKISN